MATESREDSIAQERRELAEKKTSRKRAIAKTFVWKTFKNIVFLICLSFLIKQSVEFCNIYYKYPTTFQSKITMAKELKLPAITFCFKNSISFKDFCHQEPKLCREPENMEYFCKKHPVHCKEVNTNLTIPKTNASVRKLLNQYLLSDNFNDPLLFSNFGYYYKTRTFIDTDSELLKCYSENLHLFQSGSKLYTWELDYFRNHQNAFLFFDLDQEDIELFNSEDEPQVFVAIHSPYIPINPMELQEVRPGKQYQFEIQLETEEHLLPPPYQTDCRDNGPSKDVKEFTNPNSYEMCLDLCKSEYNKAMYGCGWGMIMSEDDLCFRAMTQYDPESYNDSKREKDAQDKGSACFQNCKQGCLKLQYRYIINEFDLNSEFKPTKSHIYFQMKNSQVTIIRHVPLYGSGEIFSHVGGLLGCWLGISVFTFTDILEKFLQKFAVWKGKFGKREKKGIKKTSEISQD